MLFPKALRFFSFYLGVIEASTRRSASARELRVDALSLAYNQPETPQSSKASTATIPMLVKRRGGSDIPQLNYSDFDQTCTEPQSNLDNIVSEQRSSDSPPGTSRKSKKVTLLSSLGAMMRLVRRNKEFNFFCVI